MKYELIDIDDFVTVEIKKSDQVQGRIISFTLVGTEGDVSDGKISITSPIGNCLYCKNKNDKLSYKVGNNEFFVKIIEIIKDSPAKKGDQYQKKN